MSQGYLEPASRLSGIRASSPGFAQRSAPLLTPRLFWVAAGILILYAAAFSADPMLWLACAVSLPLVVWTAGGERAHPALLWVTGMYWVQIAADLLGADINHTALDDGPMGPYQVEAIVVSLVALIVIAGGIRIGTHLIRRPRGAIPELAQRESRAITLNRAAVWYAGAAIFAGALSVIAHMVPALTQPVLGFVLLKFVFLYILVAKVFEQRRGYQWLVLAMCYETVVGITGFIASYHAAFIVLLIAAASHTAKRFSAQQILGGCVALGLFVVVSIVWTAIKPDYRFWANGGSEEQIVVRPFGDRVEWITDRILSGKIDYEKGAENLVKRIGYTDLYAKTLARLDQGLVPDGINLWWGAVLHVVRPRVLFPNKAELDDTAITSLLTGETFGNDTSVSIGYVAEAHADFGFPGMLLPLFGIGLMLGATVRYFMTRPVPALVCEAFATASVFLSFSYQHNIDKELGGFITGLLALVVSLKFGYPYASRWLLSKR